MPARRLALPARFAPMAPCATTARTAGWLPAVQEPARAQAAVPWIGRNVFEVDDEAEREMLAELPAMLDRVDAWIGEGVLNGDDLNAADYMIASSLALLTYRTDVEPEIASRPAGALVDRVLPEPERAADDRRSPRSAATFRPWTGP